MVYDHQVIDAPRAQYTALPSTITIKPRLPALPAPVIYDTDKCKAGCYSNDQLRAALDVALDTLGRCWDQLDNAYLLSNDAAKATTP